MKITYKKWFSILGLLAAILISLFIGLKFDLSILEGAETMEKSLDEPNEQEAEEEEIEEEDFEPKPDLTLADSNDSNSSSTPAPAPAPAPSKKDNRRGQDVYKKVMDSPSTESFSVLRNF